MGDFGEITEADVVLYRALLSSPGRSLWQVAASLETTTENLDKSYARLLEMGLVRQDGDGPVAVSPMLAEATVLGAEDLELGARRAALEQRRDTIRRLVPDWNQALTPRAPDQAVEVL